MVAKHLSKKQVQLETLQEQLTVLLTREVLLMREILANMYEEEQALMQEDAQLLQSVMIQRNQPLQELTQVRDERSTIVHLLTQTLSPDAALDKLTLLLDEAGLESSEVLLLCDQLIALLEKMNTQQNCNHKLMKDHALHWKEMIQGIKHPGALPPLKAFEEKRKATQLSVMNPDT